MANISVKVFMTGLLGFLCVLLVAIGMLGVWGMSRTAHGLENVYKDRVLPLEQLKTIADDYAVAVIDAVNKANAGLFTAEQARDSVATARDRIAEKWRAYMATELTPTEAELASHAEMLFVSADAEVDRLEAALATMSGNVTGELAEFDGPLYAPIDTISGKITELVNLQLAVAAEEYAAAASLFERVRLITGVMIVLCVIATILLGRALVQKVRLPLDQAVGLAERLAKGDLGFTVHSASSDELGRLLDAMSQMQRSIGALVADVKQAIDDASHGEFSTRIDADRHNGFANEIAVSLNVLAQTCDVALGAIADASTALAHGDVSQRITCDLPGVFGKSANAVNRTMTSIEHVVGEIERVIAAAAERGDFSERVSLDGKQGFQHRISVLLNTLCVQTEEGLDDVMKALSALADGDLTDGSSAGTRGVSANSPPTPMQRSIA